MRDFTITEILGSQSRTAGPAGQRMDVVQLPAGDIAPNEKNAIYEIGDVGMLKADIAENGLRTPLEVTPLREGRYTLIAGHRRYTACTALLAEGDKRFALLPCIVRAYASEDEELVALVTSNATARELTDGERLRQYEALKGALTRLKDAGKVEGRVREELARRTGDGSGTLARLNAVSLRCVPEVRGMLERGEISMSRAYECSKLYKVQQVGYAKHGYAAMPALDPARKNPVMRELAAGLLADFFRSLDYINRDRWGYTVGETKPERTVRVKVQDDLYLVMTGGLDITVALIDPADAAEKELLAQSKISYSEIYDIAKSLYADKDKIKKEKDTAKRKNTAEKKKKADLEKWYALAREQLTQFDTWKVVAQAKALGLTFRAYEMEDGGRLVVGTDDESKRAAPMLGCMPYGNYIVARFDRDGKRVARDGVSLTEYFREWKTVDLVPLIANDLKRRAKKR